MIWRRVEGAQFDISLRERLRSFIFLVAVGSVSLLLAAETSLVGIVTSFKTPSQGRWLLVLDSDDPQLHYQLAQVYDNIDPAERVRQLRRATELSPYSRFYWSRLASFCESMGDTQCSDRARRRLLELCPLVPGYHFYAAQSLLRAGQLDKSVAQFRQVLEMDPGYAPSTWSSLRPSLTPDVVFQKVLAGGRDSATQVGYVDFLSAQGDDDAAYRIWRLAATNLRPFPLSSVQPYLERLIGVGRIEEAASVWRDLERLGIVQSSEVGESRNLIFNGDFEQSPLNAGFDWRTGATTYLAVDFSAPGAYRGAHCLRIDFTVSRNEEYEPVYQIVSVIPNYTYRVKAYVSSEDITSDTGPVLRVRDAQEPSFPEAISETTVGTTHWHPVGVSFSTGPKTRSVRLSVWRPRGRVFPTEISGSFWVDAVSLQGIDSAVEKGAPAGQN